MVPMSSYICSCYLGLCLFHLTISIECGLCVYDQCVNIANVSKTVM
uniref:Uncharacterized protein n=1 Tax=Anguilla anguilla TaxID=7936 RepID=A0A0E9SHJ4_ANGAN